MGLEAMKPCVLAINTGSSSLKASLLHAEGRQDFRYQIQPGTEHGNLEKAFSQLFKELPETQEPEIVSHRFVHGGDTADTFRRLDPTELERLKAITSLAPLHLPVNLAGVSLCAAHFDCPQIACFDTAFHQTMSEIAKRLPIPAREDIHRYGFHGLSYAYLVSQLPRVIGERSYGNIVLAHLGAGASLCLTRNLQSVDTTMGYTPCGGIPMATRSGDMDPGVILALSRRYDAATLTDMMDHHMGLVALSEGESGNMADLVNSGSQHARFAVDYFCYHVTAAIGSLAAKAGGLDAIVFSGGIGEHSPLIRANVCAPLGFMNVYIDARLNEEGSQIISTQRSLPVLTLATDEEAMMYQYAKEFLDNR